MRIVQKMETLDGISLDGDLLRPSILSFICSLQVMVWIDVGQSAEINRRRPGSDRRFLNLRQANGVLGQRIQFMNWIFNFMLHFL